MDEVTKIAAHAQRRVEKLKAAEPAEALKARPSYARAPRPWTASRPAEVVDAASAAAALAAGADGLSTWVERNYHGGDYTRLDEIRAAFPDAPLLMLDYVIDPWQLERARAGGADAVLLMPKLLGPFFPRLKAAAEALGLAVVERD